MCVSFGTFYFGSNGRVKLRFRCPISVLKTRVLFFANPTPDFYWLYEFLLREVRPSGSGHLGAAVTLLNDFL